MLAQALGDTDAAIELLTEAVEHADRIGAVHESVYSRRLLGAALLTSGDAEAARSHLETALPLAVERCYDREVVLIRALLTSPSDSAANEGAASLSE
jgi:tetratricopeptide (TPR) repeat protein